MNAALALALPLPIDARSVAPEDWQYLADLLGTSALPTSRPALHLVKVISQHGDRRFRVRPVSLVPDWRLYRTPLPSVGQARAFAAWVTRELRGGLVLPCSAEHAARLVLLAEQVTANPPTTAPPPARPKANGKPEITARPTTKKEAPKYNPWPSYEDNVWVREYTSAWTPGYLPRERPRVLEALQGVGAAMALAFDDGAHELAERARLAKAEATARGREGRVKLQGQAQDRENAARRALTKLAKSDRGAARLQEERGRLVWAVVERVARFRRDETDAVADMVVTTANELVSLVDRAREHRSVRLPGGHAAPLELRMPRPCPRSLPDETTQIIADALAKRGKKPAPDALQDVVTEYLSRRARGNAQPLEKLARLCAETCRKRNRDDALTIADSHDFSADGREESPHPSPSS